MLISVITPSFRQANYLARCASSVADQGGSFKCEHLVQDGGGGRAFKNWMSGQSSADVVSEPDGGMYDAINRGFRRARGDVLAWLNCDEQYLPGALDAVAGWFHENPDHDILFGDVVIVASDGTPLSYRKAVPPFRQHIRHCFLPTFSAATFVRRKVIDDGHFLDAKFRAIADAVWIHDLLNAGFRARVLDRPLAVFTQTGENLGQSETSRTESRQWRDHSRIAAGCWSVFHRLRKLRAGCYTKRQVTVEIYVGRAAARVARSGRVGEVWRTKGQA